MKVIKELIEDIECEVETADHYISEAFSYRTAGLNTVADTYAKIAEVELGHAYAFHDQAVYLIEEHRRSGKEYPEYMKSIWDEEHNEMLDEVAKIEVKIKNYRK